MVSVIPAGEELKSLLSCGRLCLLSSPRESEEHTLPVHALAITSVPLAWCRCAFQVTGEAKVGTKELLERLYRV